MVSFATRSLAGNIALLLAVLGALIGGNWAIQKFTIDHLLYRDAVSTGHSWASYLAQNIGDLGAIAQGKKPSAASMAFFERAQKVGNVFRYKIFDRDGRLRLVSDELTAFGTDAQNLGEHNADAARAIAAGRPLVIAKEGKPPARPPFFSEAYVPVIVDGKTIAIVEAYVDQTEKLTYFRTTFTLAAVALSIVTTLAFGIPAGGVVSANEGKATGRGARTFSRLSRRTDRPAQSQPPDRELERGCMTSARYGEMRRCTISTSTISRTSTIRSVTTPATRCSIDDRAIACVPWPVRDDLVARFGSDEFAVLQVGCRRTGRGRRDGPPNLDGLAQPSGSTARRLPGGERRRGGRPDTAETRTGC